MSTYPSYFFAISQIHYEVSQGFPSIINKNIMIRRKSFDLCNLSEGELFSPGFTKLRSTVIGTGPGDHGTLRRQGVESSAFIGSSTGAEVKVTPRTLPQNFSPFDPLGGASHRDYTRSVHGYISYSPRDMLDGGALSSKHFIAPASTEMTPTPVRTVHVAHMQAEISKLREASRSGIDAKNFENGPLTSEKARGISDMAPNPELWLQTNIHRGGKEVDTSFHAPVGQGYAARNDSIDAAVIVHRNAKDVRTYVEDSSREARNMMDRRSMHQLHGYRDKEEFDHTEQQKYTHPNFDGYAKKHADVGKAFYYVDQHGPLVPPANFEEASKELGGSGKSESMGGNIPLLSSDLSQYYVERNAYTRREDERRQESERADEFGIGRQGPLVRDGGPDQRTFQRGKNDERYLSASSYYANAYRGGIFGGDPEPSSPYARRRQLDLQIKSDFDIDRRTSNVANGRHDPYDSQHEWLGVPIKTQIDERVRMRRGAFGERSFEFFKPFPSAKHLQLQSIGTDVEGMPILAQGRQRASKEEWGLFLRYREHWYQRRTLALRYNLEPRRNETVSERDQRREKLDNLCAATPFENPHRSDIDLPSGAQIRAWFGAHVLPPPTVCPFRGCIDEPLLSIDYIRSTIIQDGQPNSQATQAFQKIPPLKPQYEIDQHTLKYLSGEQKERYEAYLRMQVEKHRKKWKAILQQRKYIPQFNCFAELEKPNGSSEGNEETDAKRLSIILDNGTKTDISAELWNSAPFEADATDPNYHLHWGISHSLIPSNLSNYVETQDALWERRVYEGVEGWSYATSRDGIRPGQVVMLMRSQCHEAPTTSMQGSMVVGTWEKAVVQEYCDNDFYNPTTNLSLHAKALADGASLHVPLTRVLVWQYHWAFPGRCDASTEETLRYTSGNKRYIDAKDPKGEIHRARSKPHFLDHLVANTQTTQHPYQSIKQVTELDIWQRWDGIRPDNYRRLTANDRKDYIIANYFHKYTPWDMICHQEDDQPLMFFDQNYISEETTPSHFTNQNRFWTRKRRSVGCIQNSVDEVRDFFRHVDGGVPWEKASRIQSQYENRMHNPLAVFHSPTLSAHRNKVSQLPLEMYEFDKKTGRVTGIKEAPPKTQHV